MKDLFPGHYKPSEKEFKQIWDKCTFVFDTNILLNVYHYSEKTRDRLFEILNKLQDRIWIPYQVAHEYQEERLNVISNQLKLYQDIQNVLAENLDKLTKAIEPYLSRHSFTSLVDSDEIIQTIEGANKKITEELEKTKNEYPDLIENDIFRDKISNLFLNNIGLKPEEEELKKIFAQAKSRLDQKIPPGYKDKDKSEDHKKYGDAILWLQLLKYAEEKKNPIIFVTDDNKEDWWKEHKGKTISPRPELIQEMKVKAQVDFWMYTGDRFLEYAEKYLELPKQPNVVEEAQDIRQKTDMKLSELAESISRSVLFPMPFHAEKMTDLGKLLAQTNKEREALMNRYPGILDPAIGYKEFLDRINSKRLKLDQFTDED